MKGERSAQRSGKMPPKLTLLIGGAFEGGSSVHLDLSRIAEETLLANWFEDRGFNVIFDTDYLDVLIRGTKSLVTDDAEGAQILKSALAPSTVVFVCDPDDGSLKLASFLGVDYILVRPLSEDDLSGFVPEA